ncbi:penicillin-binding protein [Corynebacterium atypicum]|uniref:Penicillin-binding protein n=1 Tax=Corynebacterium atypicum TaxID=191610 RepID=A0ABM5QKQ9_9CORY|nr:penicillin-binding protein 2 [Corynebacterium atypicum]AIG63386.1 penicillin-binding protein [Corynebacterium atypicum]
MNRAIRWVSVFALVLVAVLLVNLSVIHVFREDELAQNPLNQRAFLEAKSVPRGEIIAGGQVLATSTKDDAGYFHRVYPTAPVPFSSVTGYLSDRYGAAGIEQSYNGVLNGSEIGARQWIDKLAGKLDRGNNVELSLSPQVQATAYEQLVSQGFEGSVVALRPSTGEVLAMASTPSHDPNQVSSTDPNVSENTWSKLNSDPGRPLLNHATQETLPPGSIFKIITTAAALESGFTPETPVTGAASITLPNTETTLTNYAGQPCAGGGQVSLRTAFMHSCNTAFVEASEKIGKKKFADMASAFGVGETYDLGLEQAAGEVGELPDAAALGQSAIGQRDVTMSALQAAVMAATVANDGARMEPHVVKRITAPDLKELHEVGPKKLNQAVPPEVAAQITDLMRDSERNTFGASGADIASKTGTAEHGADGTPPHTWYVAFSPSENADVAVAVVVKDGGGMGESATGGRVASPIGRAVLQAALQAAG